MAERELPEIGEVRRIEVRPGDKFVVTFRAGIHSVSAADAMAIKQQVAKVLGCGPDDVLVIASHADLSVLSPDDARAQDAGPGL